RLFFFFFSSRRRHTRFKCDWSSDVCSSDLILFCAVVHRTDAKQNRTARSGKWRVQGISLEGGQLWSARPGCRFCGQYLVYRKLRSEERRVGKEGESECWTECGKEKIKLKRE